MMRTIHLNEKHSRITRTMNEIRDYKLSFKYLFWLFTAFCLIGYLFEILVAIAEFGSFQSRSGLLYGPFSQIYGIGAVLTVVLYRFVRQTSHFTQFIFYSASGALFEFSSRVIQENILGSYSWDYSAHASSFGTGRTDILFSFVWGLSAMLVIYRVYPFVCRVYDSLEKRASFFLTLVFSTLLVTDMLVTYMAVARYSERHAGEPPSNFIEQQLDYRFTDDIMERTYPTMKFR